MEAIYWLQIFLCPTAIMGGIGFLIHLSYNTDWSLILLIVLASVGALLGIFFAERVRRRIGCSAFMGRILSTPDIPDKEK